MDVDRLAAAQAEVVQRRAAGSLLTAGLDVGDRVLVSAPPSSVLVAVVLGALRRGIVPVMVDPELSGEARRRLAGDADVALSLDGAHALSSVLDGTEVELSPVPLVRPMHYTSGTTGRPKGVWSGLLGEAGGAEWVAEEVDQWGLGDPDVHLVCGPLHHSAPLRFAALTMLTGGDVVVPRRFRADTFARALVEERVSTAFVVPSHLQRVLGPDGPGAPGGAGLDVSSLRLVAHGGAPCPEPLKRRAIEVFGMEVVWELYGATEGQCSACDAEGWSARPGTVGRARSGRTLRTDADGTVWCEVPAHARFTYWGDPAATEAAWRGDAFTVGDVGRLDEDGWLFLEGRRGEIIITGGVNVAPLEVERVIASCPGVVDVAVFGVDDERWGERVCAAVVGTATVEAVLAHARSSLPGPKRPKQVLVVDAIPRNATEKVQRPTLAAALGLR